jgi:hypothetical protein
MNLKENFYTGRGGGYYNSLTLTKIAFTLHDGLREILFVSQACSEP